MNNFTSFRPSRRSFLSVAASTLSTLPLISLWSEKSFAAGMDPRMPQAPHDPGSSLAPSEKLPQINAPTERTGGGDFEPLPPEQRIGYAIVGLGHLSLQEILPAFAQSRLSRPVALVSGHQAKAERVARAYGIAAASIYSYDDFERMKDNKEIQVIYIVLPNSMHKEFTVRAAAIGKHVLCEKPMSVNPADAQVMIDACHKAERKLMIAYRQQYEPNNRRIRELVRTRAFGQVKIFDSVNVQNNSGREGGPQQWRHIKSLAGGGALPDIGLYCLSASRFLSGEEPYEVSAFTSSTPGDPRFTQIEESVMFQMRFPSGFLASCSAGYGAHESRRYRCYAESGWFGMDPAFSYGGLKSEVAYATGNVEEHDQPEIAEKNQFALEMDHFSDCVLNNKAPLTPGEEGLQDQKIMAAIYESASAGRPVQLERFDRLDVFRNPKSLS